MGSRRRWWLLALLLLLTLAATGGAGCGSGGKNGLSPGADSGTADGNGGSDSSLFGDGGQQLVVDPVNPTLDVSGPSSTLQFTAHLAGNSSPLTASWTLDVAGLGTIDGTGLFTATGLLGGQAHVTAQVGSMTGATLLTVVLQLADNPGNVPPATQMQLQGGGTADAAFKWLYPYDGTVFPRGLAAPVLQFAGTPPDATLVQVSFSSLSYTGFYGASNPGAVTLLAAAVADHHGERVGQ